MSGVCQHLSNALSHLNCSTDHLVTVDYLHSEKATSRSRTSSVSINCQCPVSPAAHLTTGIPPFVVLTFNIALIFLNLYATVNCEI